MFSSVRSSGVPIRIKYATFETTFTGKVKDGYNSPEALTVNIKRGLMLLYKNSLITSYKKYFEKQKVNF